jgi:hypothetical protein
MNWIPWTRHTTTKDKALLGCPLFRGSTPRQLREISALVTEIDLDGGTVLAREGVTPPQFVIVVESRVELWRHGRHLCTVPAGSWFGHEAVLQGRSVERVTARTRGRARLLVCTGRELQDLLYVAPQARARLEGTSRACARRGETVDLRDPLPARRPERV